MKSRGLTESRFQSRGAVDGADFAAQGHARATKPLRNGVLASQSEGDVPNDAPGLVWGGHSDENS